MQTGHLSFNRGHSSMHSAWKQCLHSGMHLIVSWLRYSDKHIEQALLLGPGRHLLSSRTSFWNDLMVHSSRPMIIMGGWGATAVGVELSCCCRSVATNLLPTATDLLSGATDLHSVGLSLQSFNSSYPTRVSPFWNFEFYFLKLFFKLWINGIYD